MLVVRMARVKWRWRTRRGTHSFPDEVISEIGGEHVHRQGSLHLLGVNLVNIESRSTLGTTRGRATGNARASEKRAGLTLRVPTTPSKIRSDALNVSTQSKRGSWHSWRSLLYVDGSPLSDIMKPDICPKTRPDLPRRSSSESGFF